MQLPFLFKPTEATAAATTAAAASWPWPTCVDNPRTLSFRATTTAAAEDDDNNLPEMSNDDDSAMITRLRSDRLFFEPGETSSILEEAKIIKNNVSIMAMDSRDPILDFRVSMEEMVAAHGLRDWESLEELLKCYLRVNDRNNHGYIIGAFVDYLLIHFALLATSDEDEDEDEDSGSAIEEPCSSSSPSSSSINVQYSFVSPLSFSSSSYEDDEIVIEKNVDGRSSSSSSSSLCKALSSSV
ncbi:hypothetical protein BUALT_Bualt11G0090900 [Buddleja alternifolia]|uniref:Transcription repressor n=1 Tax=Buddleja alternifolia TaxID=168488 RepID=A0AAV6WUK3_9LAMI|nr:hypothetical protein BUALT_Bualt11G0090900 [Buddleja alternifolia]